ncbi:MAG: glycosyltransferase family 39 protein [Ferruginibacter sp.]
MNSIRKTRNPFLLFSPFLLLYLVFALLMYTTVFIGDETRFLAYTNNLLNGFYSPASPNVDLLSGPGYPIILIPFVALHLPKICIVLLNVLMHYLSVVFLFKTIRQFASFRKSLVISLFWACYYVAYQNMVRIAYEPLTIFLITLLIFCLVKAFDQRPVKESRNYIILSGFVFGYIALTKVIFAPVILIMVVGCGLLWFINRKILNYKKAVLIMLIAFTTFVPYVIYTYNLTGRVFYLGTGADNLYWMTTPYEDEYGDWKGTLTINPVDNGNYNIPGAGDTLVAHHQKDYDEAYKFTGVEKDDAFKKMAINNIRSHPAKYAQNIFFNIGRIVFHYPFSYAVQRPKPLYVMPMNGIIVTFMLICLIPTLINWRRTSFAVRLSLFIILLYLGGSSVASAETRMFTIVVPMLLVWFAYVIQKSVKVNLKFNNNDREGSGS